MNALPSKPQNTLSNSLKFMLNPILLPLRILVNHYSKVRRGPKVLSVMHIAISFTSIPWWSLSIDELHDENLSMGKAGKWAMPGTAQARPVPGTAHLFGLRPWLSLAALHAEHVPCPCRLVLIKKIK